MIPIEFMQAVIDLHNKYYKAYPASIEEVIKNGKKRFEFKGFDKLRHDDFRLALEAALYCHGPMDFKFLGLPRFINPPLRIDLNKLSEAQVKKILAIYEQFLKERSGVKIDLLNQACPIRLRQVDPRLLPKPAAPVEDNPRPSKRRREAPEVDLDTMLSQPDPLSQPSPRPAARSENVARPMQAAISSDKGRSPEALQPLPF